MGTVLVVDDELYLRLLMKKILENQGVEVLTASNGKQALEVLKQHHVHLIITDLRMPECSGMELLEALQGTVAPPTIMLTWQGEADFAAQAINKGAAQVINKPFSKKELLDAVLPFVAEH